MQVCGFDGIDCGFDGAKIYYLFTVLHPSHKLKYFKMAEWSQEWIQMTEKIVRTEFDCAYQDVEDWDLANN